MRDDESGPQTPRSVSMYSPEGIDGVPSLLRCGGVVYAIETVLVTTTADGISVEALGGELRAGTPEHQALLAARLETLRPVAPGVTFPYRGIVVECTSVRETVTSAPQPGRSLSVLFSDLLLATKRREESRLHLDGLRGTNRLIPKLEREMES